MKSIAFEKRSKELNALALKDKSCRPETTITAENACHDLSV